MENQRFNKQVQFIIEIDKLKQIYRRNLLIDGSRNENDAEHSWHLAVMAMLLSEYATDKKLDLLKVIKMLLIHDLIEIYAGDTYCYDEKANEDKHLREEQSAEKLFSLLPSDQCTEFRTLWEEFEAKKTTEAKFAAGLDRLQPLIHNYRTQGTVWLANDISSDKVLKRNEATGEIAPALWEYAKEIIEDSISKGYMTK